jgi:hypothetical protein
MKAPAVVWSRIARRRKWSIKAMTQLRTHDGRALAGQQAYAESVRLQHQNGVRGF